MEKEIKCNKELPWVLSEDDLRRVKLEMEIVEKVRQENQPIPDDLVVYVFIDIMPWYNPCCRVAKYREGQQPPTEDINTYFIRVCTEKEVTYTAAYTMEKNFMFANDTPKPFDAMKYLLEYLELKESMIIKLIFHYQEFYFNGRLINIQELNNIIKFKNKNYLFN